MSSSYQARSLGNKNFFKKANDISAETKSFITDWTNVASQETQLRTKEAELANFVQQTNVNTDNAFWKELNDFGQTAGVKLVSQAFTKERIEGERKLADESVKASEEWGKLQTRIKEAETAGEKLEESVYKTAEQFKEDYLKERFKSLSSLQKQGWRRALIKEKVANYEVERTNFLASDNTKLFTTDGTEFHIKDHAQHPGATEVAVEYFRDKFYKGLRSGDGAGYSADYLFGKKDIMGNILEKDTRYLMKKNEEVRVNQALESNSARNANTYFGIEDSIARFKGAKTDEERADASNHLEQVLDTDYIVKLANHNIIGTKGGRLYNWRKDLNTIVQDFIKLNPEEDLTFLKKTLNNWKIPGKGEETLAKSFPTEFGDKAIDLIQSETKAAQANLEKNADKYDQNAVEEFKNDLLEIRSKAQRDLTEEELNEWRVMISNTPNLDPASVTKWTAELNRPFLSAAAGYQKLVDNLNPGNQMSEGTLANIKDVSNDVKQSFRDNGYVVKYSPFDDPSITPTLIAAKKDLEQKVLTAGNTFGLKNIKPENTAKTRKALQILFKDGIPELGIKGLAVGAREIYEEQQAAGELTFTMEQALTASADQIKNGFVQIQENPLYQTHTLRMSPGTGDGFPNMGPEILDPSIKANLYRNKQVVAIGDAYVEGDVYALREIDPTTFITTKDLLIDPRTGYAPSAVFQRLAAMDTKTNWNAWDYYNHYVGSKTIAGKPNPFYDPSKVKEIPTVEKLLIEKFSPKDVADLYKNPGSLCQTERVCSQAGLVHKQKIKNTITNSRTNSGLRKGFDWFMQELGNRQAEQLYPGTNIRSIQNVPRK